MSLSVKKIEKLQAREKIYMEHDGGGLYLAGLPTMPT